MDTLQVKSPQIPNLTCVKASAVVLRQGGQAPFLEPLMLGE
jgi:hypothetical protein